MNIQAPKGTKDLYGGEGRAWRRLENVIRELCDAFGYEEIRPPIFEHTELFQRNVGETTDVVQKEMYSFMDKGGRDVTLRPEITAGVARAFIEHGLHNEPMPAKLFYIGPCFRYENPQSGRLRQHHQFGVELYGASEPIAEAEIMSLGYNLLQRLGVTGVTLHINSLGCSDCRAEYHTRLKEFVGDNLQNLCNDCRQRFDKNPLRILDCKIESCKAVLQQAPSILDTLDENCRIHFENVQSMLNVLGIPFKVDTKIVRGFDYYMRTVFEFIESGETGSMTVIGGGRYDGLREKIASDESKSENKVESKAESNTKSGTENITPSIGFGIGIERLLLLMKRQSLIPEDRGKPCTIYIGHTGELGYQKSQALTLTLRQAGIAAESDLLRRSVKAQMKYAGKRNAKFSMIIGDNEITENKARLKNMETGEQQEVTLTMEAIQSAVK